MIRSTTLAGTAAAALLALVAAGCGGSGSGGGGGERLTLDEFVAQADAICKEYDAKFDELGEPKSASDLADMVRSGKDIASDQLAALRELSPPADVEARIEEAYATLDEQVALFDDFADAAAAEDEAKVGEISGKLDELNEKADEIAKEVGLKECGGS